MQIVKVSKYNELRPSDPHDIEDPTRAEKDLLAAVLERAIADILSKLSDDEAQKSRREAFYWVAFSDLEVDVLVAQPFSFSWICSHLGLDPFAWRKRIIDLWRERIRYNRMGAKGPSEDTLVKIG